MNKLRQLLRLFSQGKSKQSISEYTGISRLTVRKYLDETKHSILSLDEALALSDADLDALLVKTGNAGAIDAPEPELNLRYYRKK